MTQYTTIPRILLAAPGSGAGKTVVTCGLLRVLSRRGLEPVSFKCGPDYIDPMFHRSVLSIDSRNLDMFFMGKEGVLKALEAAKGKASVIEGVMGLYDGTDVKTSEGSAYEIASATDSPVLLVMPAFGVGRTIGSLILGMLSDDPERRIRGILLNGMSSSYYEKISAALGEKLQNAGYEAKLLGCIPKIKDLKLDSRHLGLKLPHEIDDIREQIDR
nr:AAA family ATPase [Lachnospiraceae bacterium]